MRATVTSSSGVVVSNDRRAPGTDDTGTRSFLIRNKSTSKTSIFLETSAAATTTDGFEWEATDPPLEIALEPGETLYARAWRRGKLPTYP